MDRETSQILERYGSSLAEVRKMIPKLQEAATREQVTPSWVKPRLFTPEQAREFGIELGPGWTLKLSPPLDGEQPRISYISPEKWEITQDETYISPEGKRYTRAELEAEFAAAAEVPAAAPAEPAPVAEIDLEELERVWAAVFPEQPRVEYLTALEEASERLQTLEIEIAGGLPFEELITAKEEEARLEQQLEDFWLSFRKAGRTPESEALLKMLGATEEEIDLILAPAVPTDIPEEGLAFPMQTDTGEPLDAKLMPDLAVWYEGMKIGSVDRDSGLFTALAEPQWMTAEEAKAKYDERLTQVFEQYKDIADWRVPGWQERREADPERVAEWMLAKEEAWDEYQLYSSEPGVAIKFLQTGIEWIFKKVQVPWEALTLEVKARDAVIRGDDTEVEREIIRRIDDVRARYGWTAIFSGDILVEEGIPELYEARKGEGYKGLIPLAVWEWLNPVYFIPIGVTFGLGAKFTTKIPVLGKALQRIASGVQAVERGLVEVPIAILKPPIRLLGRGFGSTFQAVGKRLGDKLAKKMLQQSKHLETLEDLARLSSDDILDAALADNWMKRVIIQLSRVPPVRVGIEKGLGWRVLVKRSSQSVEDIVARGATVHAEFLRRGVNAKSLKYWELFHIEPNPTKYFGFTKTAYSRKMAARLLPEFKGDPNAGTLEHVFTKPEMYNWRGMDRGLEYVTKVHEINTEILAWLRAEGVPPQHLIDDWIHRVVNVEKLPRRGPGVRRVGGKPAYEKVRKYDTMADGLAAGVPYEADINASIAQYIDQAFKKVADTRLMKYLDDFGITPAERLAERFPEILERANLTKVELADAAKFESLINRAIRGERLPGATLRSIQRRFPDLGRRFRALVEKPSTTEKELRELLAQNQKLIRDLRRSLEKAEAVDLKKLTEQAYAEARRGIPDEQKMREAFQLMEHEDRLAFRSTMDDQLKEIDVMLYDQARELEGMIEAIRLDPLASYRMRLGRRKISFDYFFAKKEGQIPETFTLNEAKALLPTQDPATFTRNAAGRVPRDYIFPDVVEYLESELGVRIGTADDLIERLTWLRGQRVRVQDFEMLVAMAEGRRSVIKRMLNVLDTVEQTPQFIPKAEPGMPEAGLQKDMFGYEHPHFPKGKGEVTQISMDDALKLDKAYKDAGLPPPDTVVKPKVEGIPELSAEITFKTVKFDIPAAKPSAQRAKELLALRSEVKALTQARKGPYWQARSDKAAKMDLVRQPDLGEGYIMQPFAGGKIYEQQFRDAFNKFFGQPDGLPGFTVTSDIAGILRITKAALDFSAMCIQGLPSWGLAHAYLMQNPKIGVKLMASWYKAFGESIAAFFVPDVVAGYVTKNRAIAMQRIIYGGSARAVDYFAALEARVGIGGWAERMMGRIPLRPYHRAETAFFGAGEIVRDEFWKILSPRAMAKGQGHELARFLDRITGLFDSRAIGVPLKVRQLEQTFMWFAPNYTRACLSVLADMFRGGMTGAETRKALGGMIAAGSAMYSGVQYSIATMEGKSHEEAWDTVMEGFGMKQDPITGETTWQPSAWFMTIKVGNYRFGFGGFWYGLLRLAGNIMACVNEVGDKERIDLVRIIKDGSFNNKDNPFIYWWYCRASPLFGLGMELGTGKDFLGYPIETVEEYAKHIITRFEPIWMEQGINWMIPGLARDNEVPEDAARAAIIPAELLGLRTFPESSWVDFYDKANEFIRHLPEEELDPKQLEAFREGKLTWKQLTKIQQIDLMSRYPELRELYEVGIADSSIRGSDMWKQWEGRTAEEKTAYYSRGGSLIERLIAGELDTRELREMWSEAGQNYGIALDTIEKEPAYEFIYNYFDSKQSQGERYGFYDDLALDEYARVMFADYLDNKGDYDWDAKDRAVDSFIEKWGEDTYQRIRQMYAEKRGMADLPTALIRLSEDKDKLGRSYWRLPYKPIKNMDLDDEIDGNIPAEHYALWKQYQALDDSEKEDFLVAHPELAKDWRAEYRLQNPEDDARLALWGYSGKIQSMEAYEFLVKWSQELGISLEQMGLGLPPQTLIPDYFDLNKIVSETSGSSAEARLFKLEHPDYLAWGLDQGIWKDDLSDESIEALRITVQYRTEDLEYDSIVLDDARRQRAAREKYLEEHTDYARARREREGYQLEFPGQLVPQYVEYYQLPEKGYWRQRYLLEHPDFYQAMKDLRDIQEIEPGKIPAQAYDEIYQEWQDLFDKYDAVKGTATVRAKARAKIFEDNPEFRQAWLRRSAYGSFFPEEQIENYVQYYSLPSKGMEQELFLAEHPEYAAIASKILGWEPREEKHIESLRISVKYQDMDDMYLSLGKDDRKPFLENNPAYADARRRRDAYDYGFPDNLINVYAEYYKIGRAGYEDDWFLMEHNDFYQASLKLLGWEPRDFSKVPSRSVFALYTAYLRLPEGDARMQYRLDHPELDDWLVLAKGYKPASEERQLTGKEKDAYEKRKEAAEAQALKDWIERQ